MRLPGDVDAGLAIATVERCAEGLQSLRVREGPSAPAAVFLAASIDGNFPEWNTELAQAQTYCDWTRAG